MIVQNPLFCGTYENVYSNIDNVTVIMTNRIIKGKGALNVQDELGAVLSYHHLLRDGRRTERAFGHRPEQGLYVREMYILPNGDFATRGSE